MTTGRSLGRSVTSNLGLGLVNNLSLRFGNLLLGIVLARLLLPADFGVFAVALTIQAVLANLTDLGMTAYLVRCDDIEERAPTVLAMGTAVGVVLAGLMAALAGPLATQLGSTAATPVVRALALTLILSGLGSVPTAMLQRRFQQGRQLVADLSSFLVSGMAVLLMIHAGLGAMSLAWSRVIGQFVAVVLLFVLSGYRRGFRVDRAIAREAYRFGLPLVGANVLSWVLINMDYVLVGRAMGATALGFYVLAFNIASWPTAAISQALRAVALPAFMHVQTADPRTRTRYVGTASALALAGSAPAGAVLLALSAPLVVALYGGRWAAAAAPLATLAAFGAIRPVFDLLATYLTARGSTKGVFVVQILWTIALLPALYAGIKIGGLAGAGLAHLVVGIVVVLPGYLFILHREGLSIGPLLARSLLPALAVIIPGLIAFAAVQLPGSPWIAILAGGTGAGLVYLLSVHRWLRRTLESLRSDDPVAEGVVRHSALVPRARGHGRHVLAAGTGTIPFRDDYWPFGDDDR